MKMALLDVKNKKPIQTVDIEDSLKEYYRLLDCDTIDITMRKVGETVYDIICDDEGLLKEEQIVSMISLEDMKPMLVGNLLFAHHDLEGNMTGLDDSEIEEIKKAQIGIYDITTGDNYKAVFGSYD